MMTVSSSLLDPWIICPGAGELSVYHCHNQSTGYATYMWGRTFRVGSFIAAPPYLTTMVLPLYRSMCLRRSDEPWMPINRFSFSPDDGLGEAFCVRRGITGAGQITGDAI